MRTRRTIQREASPRSCDRSELYTRPLPRNDTGCIGAHADYHREDYIFPRTQSLAMRARQWENQLKPIKPWGINAVANLAWHIFA